jgi:hypothetical protein
MLFRKSLEMLIRETQQHERCKEASEYWDEAVNTSRAITKNRLGSAETFFIRWEGGGIQMLQNFPWHRDAHLRVPLNDQRRGHADTIAEIHACAVSDSKGRSLIFSPLGGHYAFHV